MLDHDKVARYFERVLGVTRLDGANDLVLSEPSSIGADLLLVDLSTAVRLPSLAEMALKLADAVKGEWVSVSVNDSTNEWESRARESCKFSTRDQRHSGFWCPRNWSKEPSYSTRAWFN